MAKRKTGGKTASKANCGRRYRLTVPAVAHDRMVGWGHTRRALYNAALEQRRTAWRMRGVSLRGGRQGLELTGLRESFDWIRELPAQAAQQTLADLDRAYENWWNPEHPAGPPSRQKRDGRLSFRLPGQAVEVRHVSRKVSEVWVPKVGWLRFRRHRSLDGEVRSATLTFTPGSGWHVSFGIAAKTRQAPPNGKPGVGVDFGVACSAFCSDEHEPRLMTASLTAGEQHRLLGLERRKARQVTFAKRHNSGRYSRRLRRTIGQIASLKARQARRRLDFTHKLTTTLANNHGWVAIEDLRVKSMTASAKGTVEKPGSRVSQKAGLNRSILDNLPGERRRQLAYKAPWYGSELRLVPPRNTSRECSRCGHIDPENRLGCGRAFACVSCGHAEHADRNAAVNIKRLAALQEAQTAGPAGAKAHDSTGRPKPSHALESVGASVKPHSLVLEGRAA